MGTFAGRPRYLPAQTIAVDVDGTLHTAGVVNEQLVAWCRARKADGFTLILWSARGTEHARQAADLFGVVDLFDVIVSKPGYVVDDKGWSWIRYTHVISPRAVDLVQLDAVEGGHM